MLHSTFFQEQLRACSKADPTGLGENQRNYAGRELVAFAIFPSCPVCQIMAHGLYCVTSLCLRSANRGQSPFGRSGSGSILLLFLALYDGMQRYLGNGETTLFLAVPWWAMPRALASRADSCVVAVYCPP